MIILAAVLILGVVYYVISNKSVIKDPVYTPGPYSDEQLERINQENALRRDSISDLEKTCDVQYVDKDSPDRIAVVTGETQVLVIHFNEDGKMQSQEMRPVSPASAEFEALSAKDPINSVMEIDSNAQYGFLFSGRNDSPRLSYHYTRDGYCIEITYDDNYEIANIVKTKLED